MALTKGFSIQAFCKGGFTVNKLIFLLIFFFHSMIFGAAIQPAYDTGVYPSVNFVKNPDAEVNDSFVTDANGIHSRSTSSPLEGSASHLIDAGTSGHLIKFTTKPLSAVVAGGNCEVSYYLSGDASLYKTAVFLSTTNLTGSYLQLENVASGSKKVQMFFPCGAAADTPDIEIQATSNSAAAIKVDNVYLGKCVSCSQAMPPAIHLGTLKYTAAASCTWALTNTSYTSFSADTDCSSQTVTGSVTAPATKIPGFVQTVQAGSVYRITAKGLFQATQGSNAFRFTDGTDSTELAGSSFGTTGVVSNYFGLISAIYKPTTSGSKTIEIQAKASVNSSEIATSAIDLVFEIEQVSTASQQAIMFDQTDFPPRAYSSPSTTGLGTLGASNLVYWRKGKFLHMSGTVTTGTVSATPGSIVLPNSLTVDSIYSASSHLVGTFATNDASSVTFVPSMVYKPGTSTSNIYFSRKYGPNNDVPLTLQNANAIIASSDVLAIEFSVPIAQWQDGNAPVLIGGVTSASTGSERVERLKFGGATFFTNNCTSDPCTIGAQSGAWVTSVNRAGAGFYTVNIASGIFSAAPTCSCRSVGRTVHYTFCAIGDTAVTSTSTIYIATLDGAEAGSDSSVEMICMGPR